MKLKLESSASKVLELELPDGSEAALRLRKVPWGEELDRSERYRLDLQRQLEDSKITSSEYIELIMSDILDNWDEERPKLLKAQVDDTDMLQIVQAVIKLKLEGDPSKKNDQ